MPEISASLALGAIHFSPALQPALSNDAPFLQLTAPILDGVATSEVLLLDQASGPTTQWGNIRYRATGDLLFGVIQLAEENNTGLQSLTEKAYDEIFRLMANLGYRYIYRFWNYMADINRDSQGLERYRQFNAGRKEAFNRHTHIVNEYYPAACALGLASGPLSVAFLLGRDLMPIAIENPRQVSAYEYPEQYGPRTPSFSRATLLKSDRQSTLFISGTASIVGHETQHPEDVVAQTEETLANLQTVIDQANQKIEQPLFTLSGMFLRVYVRHAHDLNAIQQTIQAYLKGPAHAIYILADICRHDLLLEIEATSQVKLDLIEAKALKA